MSRRYVIIGGGLAADAAAQALHEADPSGQITLLTTESDPPYARPLLSKGLWKGDAYESIWKGTEKTGARILNNRRAVKIDRTVRQVHDDQGEPHGYDSLLLATGASPAHLKTGGDDVLYYRTAADYRQLRALTEKGKRFAVIGGGFIGSEVAAALRMIGREVVLLFPEPGLGARVFPADMSRYLVGFYREKGVEVEAGAMVTEIKRFEGQLKVNTASGKSWTVDGVVAGIGVRPNIELAQEAGLATDNGILVDEQLCTNDPAIFAAGDVARFPAAALGRLMRMEHEDAAISMGHAAGLAMAGKGAPFKHLPMFYSDLFELGYEAVGLLDSSLPTTADWKEPFKEGIVWYTEKERVLGALLVNTWGKVDAVRAILERGLPLDAARAEIAKA